MGMGRDKPDGILGVSFGYAGQGHFAKEFLKLSKDDSAVTAAFIRGCNSKEEAGWLHLLHEIAPDDKGTQEFISSYIGAGMGIGGRQARLALQDDIGIAVPTWEESGQILDGIPRVPATNGFFKSKHNNNGASSHNKNGDMDRGYGP